MQMTSPGGEIFYRPSILTLSETERENETDVSGRKGEMGHEMETE